MKCQQYDLNTVFHEQTMAFLIRLLNFPIITEVGAD